jgi:membrane protein implicated in regulation of membrane protease activity
MRSDENKSVAHINNPPIGQYGEVVKILKNQLYRIKYQGSEWKARPTRPTTLCLDQMVRVVGIDNITLLIEPV